MTDAIAAMRCWVSPRPAISLASRSGIIWAADSRWRGTSWFSHSITISGGDSARPDQQVRPGFAPLTPKCRKSFLVQHISYKLSQGLSVFGRRVKRAEVLYVAAEGEGGIAKRLKALGKK